MLFCDQLMVHPRQLAEDLAIAHGPNLVPWFLTQSKTYGSIRPYKRIVGVENPSNKAVLIGEPPAHQLEIVPVEEPLARHNESGKILTCFFCLGDE